MTTKRLLLGMLTPSSNTVLEPVTSAMLAGLDDASVHFGRFPVTEIALSDRALAQFDDAPILRAAELLGHGKMDVICWNGTSSGWLGFEADRELCHRIEAATGIPACTSVLALNEIFERTNVKNYAMVTPYTDDVQARILANYAQAGYTCVAERHLGKRDNFSFSEVDADTLRGMVREAAAARPDAISIFCTNLRGAPLVEELEREVVIPIYDTIATAVWKSLRMAGGDERRVRGWGSLFKEVA